jgi:VWFA-related protein
MSESEISKGLKIVAAALAAAGACLHVPLVRAQDPIGGGTIRSETKLVLVDSVVTDRKGNPVRDLAQKDFKVFEDGKEQTISTFSLESSADSAPAADRRKHYLVLFFDNSTYDGQQASARLAAGKFVETNVGPDRLIAVAEYSGAVQITQNFTDDAERLKRAVAGSRTSGNGAAAATAAGAAAQSNFSVRNALGAFRGLVKGLSTLPGRKSVIFISSGFPNTPDTIEEMNATIEECNRADVAVYTLTSTLGETPALDASDTSTGGRQRGGSGSRASPASAAIDNSPAGVQQVLFTLANSTGGFVIMNTNDVLGGFQKIGKETEEYYVLGFTPAKEAAPGTCHTLKVKVDRSGTSVRSRVSYCENVSQDVLAGTAAERDLEARMNANASPTVAGASMLTPFFYTARNTARVHVALLIPPGTFQFVKDKGKLRSTMNLVGIAWLPDGTVKARFSDAVKIAFDDKKQADAFAARPFAYQKQFPIGPGQYSFKLVFSSAAHQFGRLEAPLVVEPFDPGTFALSGLALSTSARPAREKVEGLDPGLVDDRVVLTSGGFEITPTGSNRLRKSANSFVYAELYEPALAVPGATEKDVPAVGVHMEILDTAGAAVKKDFGLVRLRLPPLNGNPAVPMGLIVTAPELEPGSYKLRLTALDDNKHQAVRTIDIQLEN